MRGRAFWVCVDGVCSSCFYIARQELVCRNPEVTVCRGLSDKELQALSAIGARVKQVGESWQAAILREGNDGVIHEEMLPARASIELALADVRFYAPDLEVSHACWTLTHSAEDGS